MAFLRFLILLFLTGCSVSIGSIIPGGEPTRLAVATLHMDTDFTETERAELRQAADIWQKQTSGVANIVLVFDLDFSSLESLAEHQLKLHHMVVKADSTMDMVRAVDLEVAPGFVLGWMSSGGIHSKLPVRGAFVMDRLATPDIAVQVMIHEFGHVLGLPHSPARQAVMFPSVQKNATNCLKKPDLALFCQVNECGNATMIPCE